MAQDPQIGTATYPARLLPWTAPSRVVKTIVLGIAFSLLWGLAHGNINKDFKEGHPGTLLSVALLLLVAVTSFRIYAFRRQGGIGGGRLIWALIGAGFVYLALDELLQGHEKIDELIHYLLAIEETAASDRIDDFIIMAYGCVGVVVLFAFRREINRFRHILPWLAAGFLLLVAQVGLDAATNGDGRFLITLFGVSEAHEPAVSDMLALLEDFTKLAAEGAFLIGFGIALRSAIERSRPTARTP